MSKIPGRKRGYRFRDKNPQVHNFTNELLEDEEIKDINKIKIDNPFTSKTTSLNNINRFTHTLAKSKEMVFMTVSKISLTSEEIQKKHFITCYKES